MLPNIPQPQPNPSDTEPKSVLDLAAEQVRVPGKPLEAPPEFRDSPVWSALVTEPLTGVCIMSVEGRVVWMNEQAARIWHGKFAQASEYSGRPLRELFPPEIVDEHMGMLKRVGSTGRPMLVRRIWRGWQTLTWMHVIPGEPAEPGATRAGEIPPRILLISRRVGGDALADETLSSKVEVVEAEIADLGPLDALSERELEVLALLGQGLSVKEIASLLFRSAKTIENHRQSIGRKLKLDDRVKLAEVARRAGLTVRDAERTRS